MAAHAALVASRARQQWPQRRPAGDVPDLAVEPDGHVLRRRQLLHQHRGLERPHDAPLGSRPRRRVVHQVAVDLDRAGVRPQLAGDEVDQRALARPVRADEAVDRTAPDDEVDIVDGLGSGGVAERDTAADERRVGAVAAAVGPERRVGAGSGAVGSGRTVAIGPGRTVSVGPRRTVAVGPGRPVGERRLGHRRDVHSGGSWRLRRRPAPTGSPRQSGHHADDSGGKQHDHEDEDAAEDNLLQERVDRDHDREGADEGGADERPEPGVDTAEDHHHQEVDGYRPVELARRDEAEEGERPTGHPGQRRGQAEHPHLHRRGTHAGGGGERLGVPDRQQHRVQRGGSDAPDHDERGEQDQADAPGERRAEAGQRRREVREERSGQTLQTAGELEVAEQDGHHQGEDERHDREVQAADPQRNGAEHDPDQAHADQADRQQQKDVPTVLVEQGGAVGAEREQSRVAEGVEAGGAGDEVEAHREDREDRRGQHDALHVEAVVGDAVGGSQVGDHQCRPAQRNPPCPGPRLAAAQRLAAALRLAAADSGVHGGHAPSADA